MVLCAIFDCSYGSKNEQKEKPIVYLYVWRHLDHIVPIDIMHYVICLHCISRLTTRFSQLSKTR